MSTQSTRRSAMTLLEAMMSLLIMAGVMTLALGSFSATAETASTTAAMTDAQLEAERLVRLVRAELAASGLSGTGGLRVIDTNSADALLEVEYTPVDPDVPLFDVTNPYAAPWVGVRRVLKFEADPGETLGNGVDDDGDLLIDEGRLAIYQRTVGDLLLVTLGSNVADLSVEIDPNASPLARIWVQVTVERALPAAVRGAADVATPPKTRHTSSALLSPLN